MIMKHKLLLMVLALGMCSINMCAQTKKPATKATTQKKVTKPILKSSREYKVEDDGFEWYIIFKNGKIGAEDKDGKTLIPVEYNSISYQHIPFDDNQPQYKGFGPGFIVKKDLYSSFYLPNGKCIIPYTRNYLSILKTTEKNFGTYYTCYKENEIDLCDINGKVIKTYSLKDVSIYPEYVDGKFYFELQKKDGYGIADGNGNVMIEPKNKYVSVYLKDNIRVFESAGVVLGYLSSISTTINPLANNPIENPNTLIIGHNPSSLSNNTSNNGSSNFESTTSTVVVEHHRDPVPFQEWQACFACGGMGTMGCDGCGGSGTKYIGDRLHRCGLCNGSGIRPCSICYGNKGKYITVYR